MNADQPVAVNAFDVSEQKESTKENNYGNANYRVMQENELAIHGRSALITFHRQALWCRRCSSTKLAMK